MTPINALATTDVPAALHVLAHGLGDGAVLPVPFPLLLLAAAGSIIGVAALLSNRAAVVTTGAVAPAAATTAPAQAPTATARPRGRTAAVLSALGLLVGLGLFALALLGPRDPVLNPAHRLAFGVLWPLLVPMAALVGGFFRHVSPLRTLSAALLRVVDPQQVGVVDPPPSWGLWPAAAGLLGIVWVERVAAATPRVLTLAMAIYALAHIAAALRYGPAWFSRGEALEVTADLVGRLSPLGRGSDGRPTLRSPRAAMALPAPPGTLGVVAALVGGHAFDFLADTAVWAGTESLREGLELYAVRSAGLFACIAVVALLAVLAARVRVLVAALVPLILGYAVAHHAPVLLVDGQAALRQLADPGSRAVANYEVLPVTAVATVIVLVFVGAHLLAVRSGHDLAFARYDPRGARAVQFPLRAVLLLSVTGGLALRFLP